MTHRIRRICEYEITLLSHINLMLEVGCNQFCTLQTIGYPLEIVTIEDRTRLGSNRSIKNT
ncbi:hypothetical protein ASD69_11685 [Lysobacter sp. Root604]|nr:hypothetical protein ASD69_11685 [Lysobacter sp. Root604]